MLSYHNNSHKKAPVFAGDDVPVTWKTAARDIRAVIVQSPVQGGVRSLLPHIGKESEGIGFKPPIGLLSIATTVRQHSGHDISIIDCVARRMTVEEVVDKVVALKPDIVGISAWTDFWYPAYMAGKLIKEKLPGAHLVYGGPHIGIYAEETLAMPFVDSVITGDGEVPFLYLCNLVANGLEDNGIPGLHFTSFGVKNDTMKFFIQKDLDALPIPDRTLLPIDLYTSLLGSGDKTTTMITSRGCPYRCIYCKLNFQKTLMCSAEKIIREFIEIQNLGIREVEIYDDTFTWSKKRVEKICYGLIESGVQVEWAVRDRVTNADPELLRLMYAAGCRRVHYGVESGVDRILLGMKKKIKTDDARRAVRLAKQAGMTVLTYFMFGSLDETVDDMRRTIRFALELDADYSEFSITIPYAGTELYQEALDRGVIGHDYWNEYAENPVCDFKMPQVIENYVDLDTLIGIRDDAIRKFYFRPKYIARQVWRLRSCRELIKKARMGIQLLQAVAGREKKQ